eukprot:330200_1
MNLINLKINTTMPSLDLSIIEDEEYSPLSPLSPITPSPEEYQTKYSLKNIIQTEGYKPLKVVKTLQGSVWKVAHKSGQNNHVIKVTKKALHDKSITFLNGKEIKILENIIKET